MKRMGALTLALLLALLWAVPAFAAGETAPPAVTADAYLVMDADTGQILIEKNGWQRGYPASITKIMTIALAMEHCGGELSPQVTVSYDAVHTLAPGSSHVALQPDEVVTLRDLFHATILASANDAANVLAEYTAGSMEAFAALMNERAAALGMNDTHFVNASGLHDDAHYTTAHDMAVLTRWAMTVPGFAELFGATEYVMPPTNKQPQERRWGTDNCMLVTNKYQYEGTLGGKSGWTQEARYTMVEAVRRGGRTLLCVVLHCDREYDKFSDSIALLDYCFDSFVPVTLGAQELALPEVPVFYSEAAPSVGNAALTLPPEGCTFWLHSALAAGDVRAAFDVPERYVTEQPFAASMTLSLADGLAADGCMYARIAQMPLGVDPDAVRALLNANTKEFIDRPAFGSIPVQILLAVLGVVLLLAALIALRIAYVAWVKAQRRRRRRARQPGGAPQRGKRPNRQSAQAAMAPAPSASPAPAPPGAQSTPFSPAQSPAQRPAPTPPSLPEPPAPSASPAPAPPGAQSAAPRHARRPGAASGTRPAAGPLFRRKAPPRHARH